MAATTATRRVATKAAIAGRRGTTGRARTRWRAREHERHLHQADAGAHDQGDREHLVPLAVRGRGPQAVLEGVALRRGDDHDRAPRRGEQRVREQLEAARVKQEEDDERDADLDRAAPREGVERGQRQRRQRRHRQCPPQHRTGGTRRDQDQRDPDRDQRRQPVPVVERVVEPRFRPGQELRRLAGSGEPARVHARQERDDRRHRDRGTDGVRHPAQSILPLRSQRDGEDAEIGCDAAKLGHASLGAARPADPERGPYRERPEQAESHPPRGADPRHGQDRKRGAEGDDPPDDDPNLAVDQLVVAAALEAEVDHEGEREHPTAQHGSDAVERQPLANGRGEWRSQRRDTVPGARVLAQRLHASH